MGIPHFLVIPYPIPGHVNPLMQLSQVLIKHGCKITFLNTEFSHRRTNNSAAADEHNNLYPQINFVTLPDGLEPEDNRSDHKKLIFSIKKNMSAMLPKLIEDLNALDADNKISCIVVTFNMGWALEVGLKLGIKGVLLWTASATTLAYCYSIPKLFHDGIIDSIGISTQKEVQLSPNMPMLNTENFPWRAHDKILFDHIAQEMKTMELGEWWLCNTTYDLEQPTFSISPKFLPIGPLIANDTNKSSFWQEDTSCLEWLDQQSPQSVIYVSFGSLAVINENQFNELALGLDLLNKPFLWVIRPSNDNKQVNYTYPDEFLGRQGKIISWAPQKKILNHPSIACFISHCGWNSTMEGLYSGVPFLCWPFASDQFANKSYICDVWKVGLELDKDENGLIVKEEIRRKVDQLLDDEDIKESSLRLKELILNSIVEGGHSLKNLENFITWSK